MNLSCHNDTLLFDPLSGYTEDGCLISRYPVFAPETYEFSTARISLQKEITASLRLFLFCFVKPLR